jgi:GTP cyclohydrolase FolE2
MSGANAVQRIVRLPDVQSQADDRALQLDAAGVKGVRYPVTVRSRTRLVPTIASFSMAVGLPAVAKGTHMSRFLELLEAQTQPLDQRGFKTLLLDMLAKLEARTGAIEMRFIYFVRKAAPVSRVESQLDHEVRWRGCVTEDGQYTFHMHVAVPATSLCPCSKEISAYGAHNQRSLISIEVEVLGELQIDELIAVAERNASCEVYGLLKRPDEKHVTERAYENPKFVEDLVRDVALELNQEARIGAYIIEAENFESIHNHSAFARLIRPPPPDGAARRSGAAADFPGSTIE